MKTILITGASRGIGAAISYAFAKEEPAHIIITCSSSKDSLSSVCNDISGMGSTCLASYGDISDETYVNGLFKEIECKYGGLDILIDRKSVV